MALTMDELQQLMKKTDLKYYLDPEDTKLLFSARGLNGTYRVIASLESDGEFIQFRTTDYLACAGDHPHLTEVLKILGQENYQKRMVKFGWDPRDGEIVAYADMWLMNNTLTDEQFNRMVTNYLPVIDSSYQRIKTIIETGTDPGEREPDFDAILEGLPPEMRELVEMLKDQLTGKKPESEDDDEDEDGEISAL